MSTVSNVLLAAIAVTLATNVSVAQTPSFTGTWKLNVAKSQLTGETLTFEKTPSGLLHFDSQGFAYDFDLSGKEFPMPNGGTTSWRAVNATTWEATNRLGTAVTAFHLTVDGDTHTAVVRTTKPDGSSLEQTSTFTRISGGPGFFGKWKSMQVTGPAQTMQIAVDGTNIVMTFPETQVVSKSRFDGKNSPVTVGGATAKQTFAFERSGSNSFKVTTKLNGQSIYVDVMTLSTDGKTLTDDGNPTAGNEPTRAVYERQ